MREGKIQGAINKEKNSRYAQLFEEIEREHAHAAAKNAEELEKATHLFQELEGKEMHAVEKLKVTQTSHGAM